MLQRIYRLRDAPTYLGMDRHTFNAKVRPYLTIIPVGKRGIGFDRLELDAYANYTKQAVGCPPKRNPIWKIHQLENKEQESTKQGVDHPDLPSEAISGGSTSVSKDWTRRFEKARERANSMKRNAT